jgi:hypothetical protein
MRDREVFKESNQIVTEQEFRPAPNHQEFFLEGGS